MIRRRQAGDTIVEVLIAIAVVSFALAGAYASVNHSLIDVRDAQEHEEALSLAASQLEILNSQSTTQLTADAGLSSFCFDTSSSPPAAVSSSSAACQNIGNELYDIAINAVAPTAGSPNLDSFQIKVTWSGLNGNQDSAQLAYQPLGDL